MKNALILFATFAFLFIVVFAVTRPQPDTKVDNDRENPEPIDTLPVSQAESFEDCVAEGNPVMESYPRQCRAKNGSVFVENIGNELEKRDLIRLQNIRPGDVIESPVKIMGEARGPWFFEASFPVYVINWDGLIIGEGIATAEGDWMTEEFVPFSTEITFEKPDLYPERGTLILQKDNPSGLPEHDDALEIPIRFE